MDAQTLFRLIPTGSHNALKRPKNLNTDRALRRLIEEANNSGDIIINNGKGYFRPDLNNPYDRLEYQTYINSKKSRIRSLAESVIAMERAAQEYNQLCL